jgi:hypothetical protein
MPERPTPNMHLPTIAPLRLSYAGADPEDGRPYSSELSVYEKSGTIVIESVSDSESKIIGELAAPAKIDWRFIIEIIEGSHSAAYLAPDGTDPAYHLLAQNIIFEGAENYATELIAFAWIDFEHGIIAKALAEASDEQLSALRSKVGSFRSPSVAQQMLNLLESARQGNVPLNTLVKRVRSAPLDFSAMQRDADTRAQIIRAQTQTERAYYEWNIAPFKKDIEHIVESWHRASADNWKSRSAGANAGAVRDYVVRWVTNHQVLPRDKHCIKYSMVSREKKRDVEFEVDFESLLARNQS